jgi:hypothetical protein
MFFAYVICHAELQSARENRVTSHPNCDGTSELRDRDIASGRKSTVVSYLQSYESQTLSYQSTDPPTSFSPSHC